MQTFRDWLEARLAENHWTAADLTRASQTPDNPRGIDSGVISRWRRPPPHNTVPRNAERLNQLARALRVPESEVYAAVGLLPEDVRGDQDEADSTDGMDRETLIGLQRLGSIIVGYPQALRATVIQANIQLTEAFRSVVFASDSSLRASEIADAAATNKIVSQAPHRRLSRGPNMVEASDDDHLAASKRLLPALVGAS